MDPLFLSVINRFGAVNTRFLANTIEVVNPPIPIVVHANESILSSIEILQKNKIGCLLVVDDADKLVGIFSERDVLMRVCLSKLDLAAHPISEVMTANPKAESASTTVAFVLQLMAQHGFRHVPLVDDEGCPQGIVSVKDVLVFIKDELVRQLAEGELTQDITGMGDV